MELVGVLIAAALVAGTPLLLAGLGLLVTERAGVVNLGAEGMMLGGAFAAFAAGHASGQPWIGFTAGIAVGTVMGALFGLFALTLRANQYASGLAITLLATGLSAHVGKAWIGTPLPWAVAPLLDRLGDVPLIGPALLSQTAPVYFAVIACATIAIGLEKSRAGLVLRAIGESPQAAYRCGLPVSASRWLAVLFGGAMCGLAGAFVALVCTPTWSEAMVGGRGWIALALTTIATWRPWRLLAGAYLVGAVTIVQFHLQSRGVPIASQWLAMLPYLATILVLVLISRRPDWIRRNMPAALGRQFVAD